MLSLKPTHGLLLPTNDFRNLYTEYPKLEQNSGGKQILVIRGPAESFRGCTLPPLLHFYDRPGRAVLLCQTSDEVMLLKLLSVGFSQCIVAKYLGAIMLFVARQC